MLTVKVPARTGRLISLEDVRIDLGLAADKPTDPKLARMVDQASAMAASFCERTFGRQIYRERILSMPVEGTILSVGPVNRIISVGIQGGAVFPEDDYLLREGRLLLTYGAGAGIGDGSAYNLWHSLRPALVVEYEAGWLLPEDPEDDEIFTGTTPLPADIERAVIQLIGVAVSEAGRDATVKSDTVEGVGSRSFYVQGPNARLPHPAAEAALEHHRIVSLV